MLAEKFSEEMDECATVRKEKEKNINSVGRRSVLNTCMTVLHADINFCSS
jgi:hypothetical protein